ncbi:homocysteine S-methyltransferase family protein [Novipirellula artificiosorum]|uniref:Bifunctional homocysteine S-methyltransferase/5,10-methylenetetrahydrofolate reductase n=1 Tax=Novipirellula artificiosorum TaxID=2528016 RepID=A0A5C6DYM7_9BACT|nr:homocysteine S-methyltransferase family protein [Novipirellula artificiosorum]TWU40511.1 Bifunctional homocysteine S-methyltransferase/5,10-methylenetetrahydrofolate reductase [Novipirellula artificiosorum]
MTELIKQLLADGPVILDGAWGTQLQQRGLSSGDCPDEWNLSHAEQVECVPRAYVEAGSQVVLTNTFRSNRLALDGYGLSAQVQAINRAAAEISLRAAGDLAIVFGSIGPSGKMLMTGEVSESELDAAFSEQAAALASAGVAAILVETMSDLAEAKLALAAAKRTGLPVVVSMVFDSGKELDRTMMGDTAEKVATELTVAGADVVGANCGQGIESYVGVCQQLHRATDLPIWIKANAGVPQICDGEVVYRTSAEEFAKHGPALVQAGAKFVGGCCGTGPEFIQALRKSVRG